MQAKRSAAPASEVVDEFLWGAAAIGRYIKRKPHQVYHMVRKKRLPVKFVGGIMVGRRSQLDEFLKG
jgi:hypothetical protein